MAQLLTDLVVDEISLVDRPANCEIVNGKKVRRAVVAIFKRDSAVPGTQRETTGRKEPTGSKETSMEQLEKVLKSGTATRDEISEAVQKVARELAHRKGISVSKAEQAVWKGAATEAYENATADVKPPKRKRKTFAATAAEAELDKLARERVRKTGESYPVACSKVLDLKPELYTQYEREKAANLTYEVPEPDLDFSEIGKQDATDDGEECPECGAEIDSGDKFCAECGQKLKKPKP